MNTPSAFRLSVLNAGGRDPTQDFAAGASRPDDPAAPHPPVNHHAYAACTGGAFHSRAAEAIAANRPILLLLRRDLGASLRVLRRLQAAGRTVAVTFKEAGAIQLAARLDRAADLRLLRVILELTDGCLAPTLELEALFNDLLAAGTERRPPMCAFIPTPYPVEDAQWDFSQPPAERSGVLVGTREFAWPSRQHLAAVLAARRLHELTREPVTVINTEGGTGRRLLGELGFSSVPGAILRLVEGPLAYTSYLRVMAAHRLVFQLDRSSVPGQVAGDALLCRLPCVGGDGAVEQIAYPDFTGTNKNPGQLIDLARTLLADPARYEQACRDGQARALESLSFSAVAARLAAFYATLEARKSGGLA